MLKALEFQCWIILKFSLLNFRYLLVSFSVQDSGIGVYFVVRKSLSLILYFWHLNLKFRGTVLLR